MSILIPALMPALMRALFPAQTIAPMMPLTRCSFYRPSWCEIWCWVFIPDAWLHSLDYATLEKVPGSYVTDDPRHRAHDVIWRVRTGEDWIYLYLLKVLQRIEQATPQQRDVWIDRVLEAATLDEVFVPSAF